jgi:tRNA dimethylallyltransferase
VDPVTAARLHPNHSQRIQRALEVYYLTGVPMSSWQAEQEAVQLPYQIVQLAIAPPREILHQRIAFRFEQMLQQGLVEEVRRLYLRGDLTTDLPSVRAVGYRQVWDFLAGEIDEWGMLANGIAATRQLAKRQMTWLRKWPGLNWLHIDDEGKLLEQAEFPLSGELKGQLPEVLALRYIREAGILHNFP